MAIIVNESWGRTLDIGPRARFAVVGYWPLAVGRWPSRKYGHGFSRIHTDSKEEK